MTSVDFWVKSVEAQFDQGWFCSLQAIAYDDGRHRVVVGGDNGKACLLQLTNGTSRIMPAVDDKIRSLCFGDTGDIYAGTEGGSIIRISADYGTILLRKKISEKAVTCLTYCNDSGIFAGFDDKRVRLVSPDTLQILNESERHQSYVQSLAVCRETSQVISTCSDGVVYSLDIETLSSLHTIYKDGVSKKGVMASGPYLAIGDSDGQVLILETKGSEPVLCMPISSDGIVSILGNSPKGRIFTADLNGHIQEWNLSPVYPLSATEVGEPIRAIASSCSSDVLAACCADKIRVFVRASAINRYRDYLSHIRWQRSILQIAYRIIRKLFGNPLPPLITTPPLPSAVASTAMQSSKEEIEVEKSLSESLVGIYCQISDYAKRIDWKRVSREIDKHQKNQLERQKQELRILREERLAQAACEARRARELRERIYQERQETIRRNEQFARERARRSSQRDNSFLQRLSRILGENTTDSFPALSGRRDKTVRAYTRRDGTKVRSYKRR